MASFRSPSRWTMSVQWRGPSRTLPSCLTPWQEPTTTTQRRSAQPVEAVQPQLAQGIRGLRIGFDRRYATENVEEETALAISGVLDELVKLGATIVDVTLPDISRVDDAWNDLCLSEAAAAHAKTFPSRADDYGPGFRTCLEKGLRVSGAEIASALEVRSEVTERLNRMLTRSTASCARRCPIQRAKKKRIRPSRRTSHGAGSSRTKFTRNRSTSRAARRCRCPAASLRMDCRSVSSSSGASLSEATLCRIGHAYEQVTEWHTRHPDL